MQEDDLLNSISERKHNWVPAANALSQNAAIQLKNRSCVRNSCRWMSMLICGFASAGSQRQTSSCQNLNEIRSGYAIDLWWVCTAGINQENDKFRRRIWVLIKIHRVGTSIWDSFNRRSTADQPRIPTVSIAGGFCRIRHSLSLSLYIYIHTY